MNTAQEMFHNHIWKETNRTFNPPKRVIEAEGLKDETFRIVLYGLTNIEMQCWACKDVKIVSCPGKCGAANEGKS